MEVVHETTTTITVADGEELFGDNIQQELGYLPMPSLDCCDREEGRRQRGMRKVLLFKDDIHDESDDEDMPVPAARQRRRMAKRAAEGEDAEEAEDAKAKDTEAEDAKAEEAEDAEDVPMVESIVNLERGRPVQESEEELSEFDIPIMSLTHEVQCLLFDIIGK